MLKKLTLIFLVESMTLKLAAIQKKMKTRLQQEVEILNRNIHEKVTETDLTIFIDTRIHISYKYVKYLKSPDPSQ